MMKARAASGRPRVADSDGGIPMEPPPIPDDDGIVMVCFPRETWNKIQEIASRAHCAPAEVLSIAIEELDKRLKE